MTYEAAQKLQIGDMVRWIGQVPDRGRVTLVQQTWCQINWLSDCAIRTHFFGDMHHIEREALA